MDIAINFPTTYPLDSYLSVFPEITVQREANINFLLTISTPRPHLRPDQDFNKRLEEICTRAEQDLISPNLLSLMIEQQEKNVMSDTQTINSLIGTLATMSS